PQRVFAWYREHPQYGLYCVPSLWSQLLHAAETLRDGGEAVPGPRCVILSGEAASPRLVQRSVRMWPRLRLWKLYGPTEATANCSAGELRPDEPVTLGQPIAGTRIFLLDGSLQPVATGEVGELCIEGPGVATGYLNLPELTRERFIPSPFDPGHGHRL